ncbi:homeotic protein female sterile [Trichonephila clavipes]|nr:homeotic protein female sterile [Trichonephila clavipes]
MQDFLSESQKLLEKELTSKDEGLTPPTEGLSNISNYLGHLPNIACNDGNSRNQGLVGVDGACRPTNYCLTNTSRLYRISALNAAPPVLTSNNEKGADTSKESDTKFLVKEISKFIHRFDLKEDISLYLKLFERQAQRLNIDQENWVSHLLGLLPTEVSHIIAREPDDKANSYEHVKDLLLKRFKLTSEKFRQLFVTHQKASERTWIDFYHELNTYFNGWIDGLKIDTFNKLSDLIITDQLKRKLL